MWIVRPRHILQQGKHPVGAQDMQETGSIATGAQMLFDCVEVML